MDGSDFGFAGKDFGLGGQTGEAIDSFHTVKIAIIEEKTVSS
jgi:hypothetical protein